MPGNSIGQLFRITTAGESHGPGNIVIIDGVPAGLSINESDIEKELSRRRPGQSEITTQRDEADRPEILAGIFDGKTTGAPLAIIIRNQNQRSKDYNEIKDKYRPGHADFTYEAKYGFRDYRGGGRSSSRETVARVAAGAVAKKLLSVYGVFIVGYVKRVGNIIATISDPARVTLKEVESNIVRCPDKAAAQKMIDYINQIRKENDSIGGIAEIVSTGVPAGWGEPVFDKLNADIAKAICSIPAVVGIEFGAGFIAATLKGSENNDPFIQKKGKIMTKTNRHGGILGGISSGMPIIVRCAVKPPSSIPLEQKTVTKGGKPSIIITKGRHDPCILPRLVPIAEAMLAIILADHCLRAKVCKL
jgi:chorismate synthase